MDDTYRVVVGLVQVPRESKVRYFDNQILGNEAISGS